MASREKKRQYDAVDRMVYEFLCDYGITEFPIKPKELCDKLGYSLVPYSSFGKKRKLLLSRSQNGFSFRNPVTHSCTVFYNDEFPSNGSITFTCLHEVFHLSGRGEFYEDEELANHFAKIAIAPPIILLLEEIYEPTKIVSRFGTSMEVAGYISSKMINRTNAMGNKVLRYEEEYLELYRSKK